MYYMIKTPWWLKKLFPDCTWDIPTSEKVIYLTFDDGPHPDATPFVLDELRRFNARATFFCIGKNVEEQPDLYARILNEGHITGNHTYDHVNGWRVSNNIFYDDIEKATSHIRSAIFRPPYGKITFKQVKHLMNKPNPLRVIMWDVLSADFDDKVQAQECYTNVTRYAKPGSIVVFHDSERTLHKLHYALPRTLKYFSDQGYRFETITAPIK